MNAAWWLGASVALVVAACGGSSPRADSAAEKPATSTAPAPAATVIVDRGGGVTTGDHAGAVIPVTARDPQWGDFAAPVTIVEFGDFECPFTVRVRATMLEIQKIYGPRKVRLVWKHNPLPFHKTARPAADAANTVFGLGGSDA